VSCSAYAMAELLVCIFVVELVVLFCVLVLRSLISSLAVLDLINFCWGIESRGSPVEIRGKSLVGGMRTKSPAVEAF